MMKISPSLESQMPGEGEDLYLVGSERLHVDEHGEVPEADDGG